MRTHTRNEGFIEIIVIVIIGAILLSILGYNPEVIWKDIVLPLLNWGWNLFITILNFIVTTVTQSLNK